MTACVFILRRLCELKLWTTLLAASLHAELIIYQGKLSLDGTPVSGAGRFKFALIGDQGSAVWSSEPMTVQVADGVYAVRLGDSAQAPPIADAALRGATAPKLRIWFERAEKGWSIVGPDVALTSEKPSDATGGAQMTAVMSELREIRALLEGKPTTARPPEAETVTVSVASAPSDGNADAPLVLVEFTDFQCPYNIAFQKTFEALKTKYVDTGKLRVVSRNVPQAFHPQAGPAARAALCAEAQGKFWPMRARLFAAGGELTPETIQKAAQDVGLDMARFAEDFKSAEIADAVQQDAQDAKAAGIVATPTFVLGKMADGKVTGVKLVGAQPLVRIEMEMRKVVPGFSPSER